MADEWVDLGKATAPEEDGSSSLHASMRQNATELLEANPRSPIFRAHLDIERRFLSRTFLRALPTKYQQHFDCRACRRFMDCYGQFALVSDEGSLLPLFWPGKPAQGIFHDSVVAVRKLFEDKKVDNTFMYKQSERYAGIRNCCKGDCEWKHMTFDFPMDRAVHDISGQVERIHREPVDQLATMLERVLHDYSLEVVRQAGEMLLEDKLSYADNHKAAIRWLSEVEESSQLAIAQNEKNRYNLICRLAASAFVGCLSQLRSGALSTLLDNIKNEVPFHEIQHQWNTINNPQNYMRPQVAPAAGNIAAAERLFTELGLTANDMRRAYLATADIPEAAFMYRAADASKVKTSTSGIFAHITPKEASTRKGKSNLDVSPESMTFTNFVKDILPSAKKVEYLLPEWASLFFLITGLPGSAPLMQWHDIDNKNRASWYTNVKQQRSADHGLCPGWVRVPYIVLLPHLWDGVPATTTLPLSKDADAFKYYHSKNGFRYLIGLEGIKETEKGVNGLCLFPTLLKSQFHGVRSTIEAYSNQGTIEGVQGELVGGVEIDKSKTETNVFRVTDARGMHEYKLTSFE